MYMYIYMYMYMYVYVCMYIYIYICICIYWPSTSVKQRISHRSQPTSHQQSQKQWGSWAYFVTGIRLCVLGEVSGLGNLDGEKKPLKLKYHENQLRNGSYHSSYHLLIHLYLYIYIHYIHIYISMRIHKGPSQNLESR